MTGNLPAFSNAAAKPPADPPSSPDAPTIYTRECKRCGGEIKTLAPTGPLPKHGIYVMTKTGQQETDKPCTPATEET